MSSSVDISASPRCAGSRCSRFGVPTRAAGSPSRRLSRRRYRLNVRIAASLRAADGSSIPPPVQVGQELPNGQEVEVRHRQVGPPAAGTAREEREELREVAVVGADRVTGGVLVEPKMLEELAERGLHRLDPEGVDRVSPASIQRARSASARSDIASLRVSLRLILRPSGARIRGDDRSSIGSMIPNVMLVG